MAKVNFAENPFRLMSAPKTMQWHSQKPVGETHTPPAPCENPGLAKSLSAACLFSHHRPDENTDRRESYFFKRFDGKIRVTRPQGWMN